MRYAIAVHGTRGDVEPCAAVALELRRRGHEISVAVPPNLVGFAESVGLSPAVPYGPDSQRQLETDIFRDWWKPRNPLATLRDARRYVTDGWAQMSETLTALASDADLILTGTTYQEVAANVAAHHGVALAALHYFPARANSAILPVPLPAAVARPVWAVGEWAHWRTLKPAEDAQRRQLGLPPARSRAIRRIAERGSLEIQAYDEILFPGLAAEWRGRRPFVGSITLALPTEFDQTVASWIARGEPPVYFGFGSMPLDDPAAALAMVTDACARLGKRVLFCSGAEALREVPVTQDLLVVPAVSHAAVFPRCQAVVHHGGSGTTAAGLRAGRPTLVLWIGADQPVWARQVTRLGVGAAQRFAATTAPALLEKLRTVLGPACGERARRLAVRMTPPERSLATAVDLLEHAARGPGG